MQIQVHTDHNIDGHAGLVAHVNTVVETALHRAQEYITRVEVHLSDENAAKGSDADKRCVMEARMQGRPPIAVTHQAATVHQAVDGAADKLLRAIDGAIGAQRDQKRQRVEAPASAPEEE